MVQAFVLIKASPGKEKDIYYEITQLDPVTEAEILYGEYDLITKIKAKNPEQLDDFVFNSLRKIEGVKSTITCICAGLFRR
ncbi:MAG: Lrp/AsnC family transcriptional regulator [Candidatus Thorarchaeota archaeon]